MSGLLLRFEAIESRTVTASCPRGTTGRVHSLRLRRCFHGNGPRQQSVAQTNSQPAREDPQLATGGYALGDDAFARPDTLEGEGVGSDREAHRTPSSLGNRNRQRRIDAWNHRYDINRGWIKRLGVRRLDGYGDVLPLEFPDTPTTPVSSPDEGALYSALKVADPHVVLKALVNLIEHDGYSYTGNVLASIPPTTFSEILRCLDPKHFVSRFANLHKEIGPHTAKLLGIPDVHEGGYLRFCWVFLGQVHKILEIRTQQSPLTTSDVKYLLKCSRATGNTQSAEAIWRTIRSSLRDPAKRIVPDAECYNHYLATKCWSDTFNAGRRYNLRIVPSSLRVREWDVPPYAFQGHQVGPQRGIKAQAAGIFREMVESGISGNEETFCLMMVAMAREGDVPGIANILQRVWGIDVESLLTKDESDISPPTSYAPGSPFYPSEQILFSIAHVYGINNMIPTALRLVDYFSRQYNIDIPVTVWNELLQWTFVLSSRRTVQGTEMNDEGLKTGQLPPEAVSNLWNTMTSEPYHVEPTMEMYNRLVTNLLRRHRYGEARTRIEEAHHSNLKHIRELSQQVSIYEATLTHNPLHRERTRQLNLAHLRVRRNRLYIRRWVQSWIWNGSKKLRFDETFTSQELPSFLERWKSFLPVRVKYSIAGGKVSFATGVKAVNFRMQRRYANRGGVGNLLSKRFILPSHVPDPGMLARRAGQGRLMDRYSGV